MGEWFDVTAFPGIRGRRVHAVAVSAESALREALTDAAFRIHTLEGARITGPEAFFEEIARSLDLPKEFGHNWDALIDALGDFAEEGSRIAILWRSADKSLAADVQTVVEAVLVLDGAASGAGSVDNEGGPTQLEIFLIGAGSGFGA